MLRRQLVVGGFGMLFLALAAAPSVAADLMSLSWGDFVTTHDGPAKAVGLDIKTDESELTADVKIEGFTATADGEKTDAAATFSGHFLLTQPKSADLSSVKVVVSGLIIKTAGTDARLDMQFGGIAQTIEWQAAEIKNERFEKTLTLLVPGGRLPTPFDISAILLVKRNDNTGAVLISVDSLRLEAGPTLIGQNWPGQYELPTLRWAMPAEFASR